MKKLNTKCEESKTSNLYYVDKILNHRFSKKKNVIEFLVKWYRCKETTWEPYSHFETKDCIRDYFASNWPLTSVVNLDIKSIKTAKLLGIVLSPDYKIAKLKLKNKKCINIVYEIYKREHK